MDINLNSCKPGDVVTTRTGVLGKYLCRWGTSKDLHPHAVKIPMVEHPCYFTDEGYYFCREGSLLDIVGIVRTECALLIAT
jgi:hypothetical protein